MKILFQIPSLENIYAIRTIYHGYRNAFIDLGHDFMPYTSQDSFKKILEEYDPDILFTSLHRYFLKYLDLAVCKKHQEKGMAVFVSIPYWNSPFSKTRINEGGSLKDHSFFKNLITNNRIGNFYFNQAEQGDKRMDGFEEGTGEKYVTIPLACDKFTCFPEYSDKFKADISFIGTNLPDKRRFFRERVFPLGKLHDLKLYGQDWTQAERFLGYVQKVGQYFNIPMLSSIQKPKLSLDDERKIYNSSTISINVHEDYQKRYGGDCNERTFKIPACGGFEITDDVACIRKYFKEGEEMVIALDRDDWFDKINYFLKYPHKREPVINAGRIKVLEQHTYHNRVKQIMELCRFL